MTTAQIQTLINTAKCCLGDLGCKIKFKAEGGIEYSYTFLMAKLLRLYILALENYLTLSCTLTDTQLNCIRDHINRICGCSTSPGTIVSDYFEDGITDPDYV